MKSLGAKIGGAVTNIGTTVTTNTYSARPRTRNAKAKCEKHTEGGLNSAEREVDLPEELQEKAVFQAVGTPDR